MRPNLSVEKIAGALAVLGASVLITACGGDEKKPNTPVNGSEVSPTSSAGGGDGHCGADKSHKPGEASCGAKGGSGSCGAGKGGAGSCGAGKTGGDTHAADTKPGSETATPASTGSAAPASSGKPAASGSAAPKASGSAAPKGTPATGGKKGGSGSCGAGTCAAKK